jgi:hypothetical protein
MESTVDLIIFALLISVAVSIPLALSHDNAEIITERYAASFARSTLVALLNTPAEQFGGFSYRFFFNSPEFRVPFIESSTRRKLDHKTIAQLLAEDALLNLRLTIDNSKIGPIWSGQEMDEKLRIFLKSLLDNLVGGRFGYRLRAKATPVEVPFICLDFDLVVENLYPARAKLCSETLLLSLPAAENELTALLGSPSVAGSPWPPVADPIIEISLELWSR